VKEKSSEHNIYIPDEDCYGSIISLGAYASLIQYDKLGISHEEFMDNEDFIVIETEEN
jgi:hypothetical protein